MEGSVLSFLKAEWKVSDTGSAHWASSSVLYYLSDNTTVSMRVTIKEMFFNFKFLLEVQMYFFHVHFNTNLFFPFK
jgi:hypothetical protein